MADAEKGPWVCKECGEIASGYLCNSCGNTPEDDGPPVAPAALRFGLLARPMDRLFLPIGLAILLGIVIASAAPVFGGCGR